MAEGVESGSVSVRRIETAELTPAETAALRDLLWAAFGSKHPDEGMTEADWEHALGGVHFLLYVEGAIAGHAAVVEREIHVAGRPLRTGYVEAVAVQVGRQRRGLGSVLIGEVNAYIRERFELGALGTSVFAFYGPLGWAIWRGPSSVRTAGSSTPTPEEDGFIMVLTTPATPPLDLDGPISCEWRDGDVW